MRKIDRLRVDNNQGEHIELRLRLARHAPDKLHVVLIWQVAAWLSASDEQRATYSRDLTQPSLT